jgi:hypothetical protein
MSTIESQFKEFLSNINPDEDAVKYAQKAHEPLRDHLSKDKEFGSYFVGSFLYGSYKRYTAVGDIKDVDIVILTNFSEKEKPNDALKKLKSAIARYYKDPENQEYQRRSIRVNTPLPDNPSVKMTLDVIPAILPTDDESPLKVPDREVGKWIWSHPKGHIKHTSDLNKENVSDGRFVPLVKIMKWWWKYQCKIIQPDVERPKPKGFWVECLTGENFDRTQHDFADHFIGVLQNVLSKYQGKKDVPMLNDPGLSNEKIKSSMTISEFDLFMMCVSDSLSLARKARDISDDAKSSQEWQKIFGPKFPLSENRKENSPIVIKSSPQPPWLSF